MECAVSMCPVTLDQVLSTCVLFSFSQAWQLGRAVMCASTTKMSVVQAITEQEHGVLLISGKVTVPLIHNCSRVARNMLACGLHDSCVCV